MRMRRGVGLTLVLGLTSSFVLGSAAIGQQSFVAKPGVQEFSGRLIARPIQADEWIESGRSEREVQGLLAAAQNALAAYTLHEYVPQTDESLIVVPDDSDENRESARLMATGLFQYVEPDWIVYPIGCPDDPRLNNQWHHDDDRLQSCDGWDLHTGDPTTVVAICDTGIRTSHEDFQQHRYEGYNAVDRLWENQGGDIGPIHPHGTNTTGCAAANGDNGVGIAGVGWNLGHRMMRVSNSSGGGASLGDLQHAARLAVETGDRVASVSYSGVDANSNLTTATYIKSIGGLLVWAAGNDNRNLTRNDRDDDDLIVAGGTDVDDSKASFSAFGPFVDVVAPAVSVYTTDSGSDSDYGGASGTSFACPLTAGLCALIFSANPDLSPDDVESILKNGCDDLGSPGIDNTFAYGRINIYGSLSLIRPINFNYPSGRPSTVVPYGGDSVQVQVTADSSDPIPGTGTLHYNDGSGWKSVAMSENAPNDYDGVFPGFPGVDCGANVEYYYTADASDGQTYSDPAGAPSSTFSTIATESIEVVADVDFESAVGWTVTSENLDDGEWDRGVPVGGGDRGDPGSDFDGSGQCFLTDNVDGNSDVDGGPTRLLSPVYDVSGVPGLTFSYARWFTNDDNDADRLVVEVSDNAGGTWNQVESVGDTSGWVVQEFDITSFVNATDQFQIRVSATDNPNDSVTEAGFDRFKIQAYVCPLMFTATPGTVSAGDTLTFTTWKGQSGGAAAYFVTAINGSPTNLLVSAGSFPGNGIWQESFVIPDDPAFPGLDVTFTAYGVDENGVLVQTNDQNVSFQ